MSIDGSVKMSKGHIIRERYEATAKGYDELYRAEQFEKYFVALKKFPPYGRVLDAGCGTGLLIEYLGLNKLLSRVDEYVCLDYSRNMLDVARGRAKLYCPSRCLFVEGNVESLPFRDKVFDIVYSFTVLDLVDDLEKAIKELSRVSRSRVIMSLLKNLRYKDLLLEKKYKLLGTTSKDVIFYI